MLSVVKLVLTYPVRLVVTLKKQHNTSNDEISYYYSASLEEVTEKHTKPSVDKPFTGKTTTIPLPNGHYSLDLSQLLSSNRQEKATSNFSSADIDRILDNTGRVAQLLKNILK